MHEPTTSEEFWTDPIWKGIAEGGCVREIKPQNEKLLTLDNGGTPPSGDRVPIILLAGAIKWWWQAACLDCGHWDDAEIMRGQHCLETGKLHKLYVWWNSVEHRAYVSWRDRVRERLISEGYLTYAPYMAFKGQWDERAQRINDAVIDVAAAVVVLSPTYAITEGTDEERRYAKARGVPVFDCPPMFSEYTRAAMLRAILSTLGSLR